MWWRCLLQRINAMRVPQRSTSHVRLPNPWGWGAAQGGSINFFSAQPPSIEAFMLSMR